MNNQRELNIQLNNVEMVIKSHRERIAAMDAELADTTRPDRRELAEWVRGNHIESLEKSLARRDSLVKQLDTYNKIA